MKYLLIVLALGSTTALAKPDCSVVGRASAGLYSCESKSHDAAKDQPRKVCTWNKVEKECTCCIYNDEVSREAEAVDSND